MGDDRPSDRTEIHLPTNLPARDATAVVVAELYRRRWTIEGLFLEVGRASVAVSLDPAQQRG